MANKTAKELEIELQAALDAAKKIEINLNDQRGVEAKKAALAKKAADKRAKKSAIKRKAELDTLLVDYEDVVAPKPTGGVKKASVPSVKVELEPAQEIKPVEQESDQPTGLWAWLMKKD